MKRPEFRPAQAEEIARAFQAERVEYLFIGKSGAILLGYPGSTQDVDIDLPLLENFRAEWEKRHPAKLKSASDIAAGRSRGRE